MNVHFICFKYCTDVLYLGPVWSGKKGFANFFIFVKLVDR